jgi:hypothetical protein
MQDPVQAPPEQVVEAVPSDAPAKSGIAGFASSPTGRIIVIAGAVAVLIVIAAVVAFLALGAFNAPSSSGPTITIKPTKPGGGSVASGTATAATTETPPPDTVDDSDVFVPRDPFKEVEAPHHESGTTMAGDLNTVVLIDIISEDGEYKAVVELGGQQYTVAAGQQIGTTPWQCVSVSKTSAVFLYGDNKVTLTPGQGVSK